MRTIYTQNMQWKLSELKEKTDISTIKMGKFKHVSQWQIKQTKSIGKCKYYEQIWPVRHCTSNYRI